MTSQAFQDRGLKSVADLSNAVPNATFRRVQGAFGPGVSAFIRGIGQADTSLGSEPSVAYYIDDVYYPILLGSNFDLLDLDHIEVLRGPKGTLFGRNALAGAVNIVSKQPSTTEASGYVQATTGRFNRLDFRAGFNVPLNDKVALMVGVISKQRDGYQKLLDFRCDMNRLGTPALGGSLPYASGLNVTSNNFTPTDCQVGTLGGENVRAGKVSVLFQPQDNVKLTLNADYTRDRSENPADQLLAVTGPGGANLQKQANAFGVVYDSRFVTNNPFTSYATYSDPTGAGVIVPGIVGSTNPALTTPSTFHNGRSNRGGAVFPSSTKLDNWGLSAKAVIGLTSDIDLTAVLGYRKLTETHAFDIDGSPLVLEHTLLNIGESYKNAELRLAGKSDLVDWVVGGFYFTGDGFTHAITYSPQSAFYKIQNIKYDPTSKAAFANLTVKPIEGLGITAGLRYSDDGKEVDFSNVLDTNAVPSPLAGDTIFKVHPRAKRWDWKLGANYHVNDDVMVYASASTGSRLPGYNTRPQQPTQVVQFAGEKALAYEVGFKADMLDRKLRLNAAAFYTDYKTRITNSTGAEINLLTGGVAQPGTCVIVPGAAGGPGATTCRATAYSSATDGPANPAAGIGVLSIPRTYFVNTPGKVKGFELELQANPIEGLSINGAVGYAKFDSPDLKARTFATGRITGIPEWNANAGLQYQVPFTGGTLTPRLDWFYTGNIKMSAARSTYDQPAYSLFNGRLTYHHEEHDFTVSLGANNLLNKHYYYNFFIYQDIGFPNVNGQPGRNREWFLELGKKF